ncbi:MAG: hypothetical protein CVV44_03645 [Spirochaetae bacterium HGW-Spirochaetae-1]|jgi:sigma-B regulation protein RsbU (phosphoserine phosphatase)|nr:MAG: hypothetical protein CVV44_03645 [Spirochaetae bacterium HGW-Spirochaetae-1]
MKQLIAGITVLLIFLTACDTRDRQKATVPQLKKGFIDLSNHDFLNHGPVNLSGTWEFYWNTYLVSRSSGQNMPLSPDYIFIPHAWHGFTKKDGGIIPYQGFASYRAIIDLPDNINSVGIYIPFIYSSYRAYASDNQGNMVLIGSGGDPGMTAETTRHLFVPLTASFQSPGATTIVLEVADFSTTYGGMRYSPIIGLPEQVFREREIITARDLFVIGCLIIIGLYNLILFLLRRNEKAPLWLGISCIDMAFRTYLKGRYFEQFNTSSESFELMLKLSFLTMYAALPFFMSFLQAAFSRYISIRVSRALWITISPLILFVLFSPVHAGYQSLIVFHIMLILFCVYGLYLLIGGAWRDGNYLVLISLSGLLAYFIFAAIDILEANNIIRAPHITHLGLLLFIFAQAFIVASQNAMARGKMERLSVELTRKSSDLEIVNTQLQNLNINLENKVEERTGQLETANKDSIAAMEEMELINESLIKLNLDLENAQRIMKHDMDMAEQVQSRFLPKTPPLIEGWDIAFVYKAMSGVSGDFYDFYSANGNLTGISLFDVSGHGIASALITMISKSVIFRVFRSNFDLPLNKVMDIIDEELISEIGSVGNYLTGIILRIKGNAVEYVNGAHTNLLLKKKGSPPVSCVHPPSGDIRGKLIGMSTIDENYTSMTFSVDDGDYLLLYSDCLIESARDHERYGMERLKQSFQAAPQGLSAHEMIESILGKFYAFTGNTPLQDDLTVIVVKKTV